MCIGYAMAYRKIGVQACIAAIMKRVAYATRYGGASLFEAATVDQHFLQDFVEATSEIVREENASSRK